MRSPVLLVLLYASGCVYSNGAAPARSLRGQVGVRHLAATDELAGADAADAAGEVVASTPDTTAASNDAAAKMQIPGHERETDDSNVNDFISIDIIPGGRAANELSLPEKIQRLREMIMPAEFLDWPNGIISQLETLETKTFGQASTDGGFSERINALAKAIDYNWCTECSDSLWKLEELEIVVYQLIQDGSFMSRLKTLEAASGVSQEGSIDDRLSNLALELGHPGWESIIGEPISDDDPTNSDPPPVTEDPVTYTPPSPTPPQFDPSSEPAEDWCGISSEDCLSFVKLPNLIKRCAEFGTCACGVKWLGFSATSGKCSLDNKNDTPNRKCGMAWVGKGQDAYQPCSNFANVRPAPTRPIPAPAPGSGSDCGGLKKLLGGC